MIKDYCIENKVAIKFTSESQLIELQEIFEQKHPTHLFSAGGIVSFYREVYATGAVTNYVCNSSNSRWFNLYETSGYTVITIEEFMQLETGQGPIFKIPDAETE